MINNQLLDAELHPYYSLKLLVVFLFLGESCVGLPSLIFVHSVISANHNI